MLVILQNTLANDRPSLQSSRRLSVIWKTRSGISCPKSFRADTGLIEQFKLLVFRICTIRYT